MSKHLRISCEHKNVSFVLQSFINKFKPVKWFAAYENKNELEIEYRDYIPNDHTKCRIHEGELEKNPHIQALMVYHEEPSKQTVSDFFKKMPILKGKDENGKNIAGYYHKEIKKSEEENLIYMLKDGHIISYYGWTDEEINELTKKSELINENKKLSSREKLYKIYIEKYGIKYPSSKYKLFEFIDDVYIFDFKKSTPNMGMMGMNSRYILKMIHHNIEDKDNDHYEIILKDIYNIKVDLQDYIKQALFKRDLINIDNLSNMLEAQHKLAKTKEKVNKYRADCLKGFDYSSEESS